MRILFLNPPSIPYALLMQSFGPSPVRMPQVISMPLGILYLAAVLERDLPGIEIQLIDIAKRYREWADSGAEAPESFESFVEAILARERGPDAPDMIGISILFSTADKSVRAMARVCKKRWPRAPLIVGGMHATNAVTSLLLEPAIDYVCRGEGEAVISQVVSSIGKGDVGKIPGIIGRATLMPENCPMIDNLDTIPYPAWHLINMKEYAHRSRARSFDEIEQDCEATIMTTRGCPLKCTFCSSWTVHGREMRYRSIENVLGELRILIERYGVTSVIPEDDLFSVKKARVVALCNAVADTFPGMLFHFPSGLAVFTLDAEVIRAMKRMGMRLCNVAIESGSEDVQNRVIKKHVDLDRARRVVQTCRDEGVMVRCYFVVGFPGETREQILETFSYAASLPTDWCVFSIAAPLVGTEMYAQLLARGEIDATFNWDYAFFQERSYDTPEISAADLKALRIEANERINFTGNYNLRMGYGERAASLFKEILHCYPDHQLAKDCLKKARSMQTVIV